MMVFPQYFLKSFAYAGIAVVLLAAAAALVLLPAALVLLGDRVNALDLRKLFRRRKATGPRPDSPAVEEGAAWGRTAALVMRRAPYFAIATTAGLVLLGLPFLGVKFGTADDRQLPSTAESHVVQQHLREGFPGTPAAVWRCWRKEGRRRPSTPPTRSGSPTCRTCSGWRAPW